MNYKNSIAALLFFSAISLSAQQILPREGFFPGTMTFTDGHVQECIISAPKHPGQGTIYYMVSENGKKQKMSSKLLVSITINTPQGHTYYFDRESTAMRPTSKHSKPVWLFKIQQGYATLYEYTSAYIIDRKGNAYTVSNSQSFNSFSPGNTVHINEPAMIYYYIKKKNQPGAYYMGMSNVSRNSLTVGGLSALKKLANWYLSEDQDLIKEINAGNFKWNDIKEVVQEYNDFMNKR